MKINCLKMCILMAGTFVSAFSFAEKPAISDRAVFRVQGLAYFTSDLNHSIEALKAFSCVNAKAPFLIEALGGAKWRLKDLPAFVTGEDILAKRKEDIDLLLSLTKLKSATRDQINAISPERIRKELPANCLKNLSIVTVEQLLDLVRVEQILRERFGQENPDRSRVRKEALGQYMATLMKSTSHEFFE
jgi:hypothetical protein